MVIDIAFFIFVVTVTTLILAFVIGGKIVAALVRSAARVFTGNFSTPPRLPAAQDRPCPRRGCGVPNPAEARFCRHCGTPLTMARPASVTRRAACW